MQPKRVVGLGGFVPRLRESIRIISIRLWHGNMDGVLHPTREAGDVVDRELVEASIHFIVHVHPADNMHNPSKRLSRQNNGCHGSVARKRISSRWFALVWKQLRMVGREHSIRFDFIPSHPSAAERARGGCFSPAHETQTSTGQPVR